jgi:hypothetical protein
MMSAQARIDGYTAGYPEFLSVTYEHPDFTYNVSPYIYCEVFYNIIA